MIEEGELLGAEYICCTKDFVLHFRPYVTISFRESVGGKLCLSPPLAPLEDSVEPLEASYLHHGGVRGSLG